MPIIIFVRSATTPYNGGLWRKIHAKLGTGPYPLSVWDITREEMLEYLAYSAQDDVLFVITETQTLALELEQRLRHTPESPLVLCVAQTNILQVVPPSRVA